MSYAEQVRIATEMREMSPAERELAIVFGVLSGKVLDGRKQFRPENAVRVCSDDWCD